LIFFSPGLEKLIERVWRRSPFSRVRDKKGESASRESGKGEEKAVAIRERSSGQERRQEDYEPTPLIYKWWLVNERRKWERVEEYFGVMSEYERAGESGCNVKYGAEILRKI
jgi:hypothetical protein